MGHLEKSKSLHLLLWRLWRLVSEVFPRQLPLARRDTESHHVFHVFRSKLNDSVDPQVFSELVCIPLYLRFLGGEPSPTLSKWHSNGVLLPIRDPKMNRSSTKPELWGGCLISKQLILRGDVKAKTPLWLPIGWNVGIPICNSSCNETYQTMLNS